MYWKEYGWKIAYFFVGTIGIIGVGRFFLPFWLRFSLLVVWALGLVFIFIRVMESRGKVRGPACSTEQEPGHEAGRGSGYEHNE